MRFLIFFAVFLTFAFSLLSGITTYSSQVSKLLPDSFWQRDIKIVGNHVLDNQTILGLIPAQVNLAWYFLPEIIDNRLEMHPLIDSVKVKACEWWRFDCYVLEIKEEQPSYVYKVSNQQWLIDEEGGFLAAVNSTQLSTYFPNLVVLEDVDLSSSGMEVRMGRLKHLITWQGMLGERGMALKKLTLTSRNDFELEINGVNAKILLSNYDQYPDKFSSDIQSLSMIINKQSELPNFTKLDLRPSHPVLQAIEKNSQPDSL